MQVISIAMRHRCINADEGMLPMYNKSFQIAAITTKPILIFALLFLLQKSSRAAPSHDTAYACEGKTLTIKCDPGYVIQLIRANYGRFSIAICNDHGNGTWSVTCAFREIIKVLESKCNFKQNCSVLANTSMFADPCPGTLKYLEAQYECISVVQSSTTTYRPTPPRLFTNQLNVWVTTTATSVREMILPKAITKHLLNNTIRNDFSNTLERNTPDINSNPNLGNDARENDERQIKLSDNKSFSILTNINHTLDNPENISQKSISNLTSQVTTTIDSISKINSNQDIDISEKNNFHQISSTLATIATNNNSKENNSIYCGPALARNLFWNLTRVGEANVQPCPGGATGIAKWRCVFLKENLDSNNLDKVKCDKTCDTIKKENIKPTWYPNTPDLTQCRSLWLNNLEIRVNQRDSSLNSIANDLSQVTSSKILYGGDMLVTTKIIQTISEKMSYDIEAFSDQREREAIIYELLHGVVKTGSNLLDISHQLSWLDLSFEDQMRVATSLLTGLEDNAFLLADTIVRERNIVQKVKNILLSVRVLEAKNIIKNEIFPDTESQELHLNDDRIELPRDALIENSENGLVRIVFVAFDRLEEILKPNSDNIDVTSNTAYIQFASNHSTDEVCQRILNTKVISASLGKGRHIQLSHPIRLVLRHIKTENVSNPTCVFWNYIDHAWSDDGCYLESTNKTHSICMCNHLTNFAVLMDINEEHESLSLSALANHFRIFIYISIAVCILFIIIAILTLKIFNGTLSKEIRTSIYKNFYICLFIVEVLFLCGIQQNEVSVLCGFTTVFLHCFILSIVVWLFLEGFQIYMTLTSDDILFETEGSSKVIWYYLLSYGLPFTIVAISLAINPSSYTKGDYCILMESNYTFYTTFLIPVLLFLLATLVFAAFAFYTIHIGSNTAIQNKSRTKITKIRFNLRCLVMFLIIIPINWICAYIYLRDSKLGNISYRYGYVFTIFNMFLGIYIFVFHCIQNEKIRREYKKCIVIQKAWIPNCLRKSKSSSPQPSIKAKKYDSSIGNKGSVIVDRSNEINETESIKQLTFSDCDTDGNIIQQHTISKTNVFLDPDQRQIIGFDKAFDNRNNINENISPANSVQAMLKLIPQHQTDCFDINKTNYQSCYEHVDNYQIHNNFEQKNFKKLGKNIRQFQSMHHTKKPEWFLHNKKLVNDYRTQRYPIKNVLPLETYNQEFSHLDCDITRQSVRSLSGLGNDHLSYRHIIPEPIRSRYNDVNDTITGEPIYEEIPNNQETEIFDLHENNRIDDKYENQIGRSRRTYLEQDNDFALHNFERSLGCGTSQQSGHFRTSSPICQSFKKTDIRRNQPKIPARNLSAILDENNTVVCYLEPLPK